VLSGSRGPGSASVAIRASGSEARTVSGKQVRTTWHLYLDRLPAEARSAFVAEVANRYAERYPSSNGCIHVPMVRLEVEAV